MGDVLILGCGYLGKRLAARCAGQVFVTTRSPTRAEEFRAADLKPILCDVTEPDSLAVLPNVETVYYCIGLDRSAGKPMRAVYVDGLRHVLDKLPPPRRFLYVSSSSVYGQQDGAEVDETAATCPVEEAGRIILAAEELLRERLPSALVMRFAGIYGRGRLLRAQALRNGEPLVSDPEKWLNLIHVEDGVTALLAAAERGQEGAVYLTCDDEPVRRRDFYTFLAESLKAPPPTFLPPPEGQTPPHESANRRLSNRRLRQELGVELLHPNYRSGIAASL